jgi:two-component system response regulator RpfG
MQKVVVIDDDAITRMIIREVVLSISEDINVTDFADATSALDWTQQNSADLVLTDYKMPNMNGLEFLKLFKEHEDNHDTPVIFISSEGDRSVRHSALSSGAIDFLGKPVDHLECKVRCENMLKLQSQNNKLKDHAVILKEEVVTATFELHKREEETLIRLAKAGEYRDSDTGMHIFRIEKYTELISRKLGLEHEEIDIVSKASRMHDIGKIGIPDSILLKNGKLTTEEFERMKEHTLIGYEMLSDSPSEYLKAGAIIALNHHEKYDGTGYPNGLTGGDIPLEARIVSVVDVFDALMSKRPYKKPWTLDEAFDYIKSSRGQHLDPSCVDMFIDAREAVEEIHHEFCDD